MNTAERINGITYSIEKDFEVSTHTEYEQVNEFDVTEKEVEYKYSFATITFKLEDKTFEVNAQYDCAENWAFYDDISLSLERVAYKLCKALDIDDTKVLNGDIYRYGQFTEIGEALEKLLIKALEESEIA